MTPKTIPFLGEKAYCPFYTLDPDLGFVVASVLTTSQELGLRVAARLVAGQAVVLDDGSQSEIVLRRRRDVEIPLPKDPSPSEDDAPAIRYKAAYTRTHPLRLETGVDTRPASSTGTGRCTPLPTTGATCCGSQAAVMSSSGHGSPTCGGV